MRPRSLSLNRGEWAELLGARPPPGWPSEVTGVQPDSRRIRAGNLFVAVAGHAGDGHGYVEDAIRRGAAGIVSSHPVETRGKAPSVVVRDAREMLTRIALELVGHPDRDLRITGVTGTNGKTSVAGFIHQLLTACGTKAGLLGTVNYTFGHRNIPAQRTTPGAPDLQNYLREMVDAGCSDCVMEISSHALDQKRVAGLNIETAVFTNLSQDHLDYHGDMEAYFASKLQMFNMPSVRRRIVGDDAWSERLAGLVESEVIRCGFTEGCDVRGETIHGSLTGIRAMLRTPWGEGELDLPLPGEHNLRNALQALAVMGDLGFPLETVLKRMRNLQAAPGRLQPVPSERGRVLVDYAHTPDALTHVLGTLRPLTKGRLIVVFGCGGDRDRSKRPLMTEAAAEWADELILTQDNPRTEDPEQIFDDMRGGLKPGVPHRTVSDRREAIHQGIEMIEAEDVLLIAGKGHETVQYVGAMRIPFDDREVAARLLKERDTLLTGGR